MDIFMMNLFARFLLVACLVVAFRFARRRSSIRGQYLLLCAGAGAVSSMLFAASVVITNIMWFPSTAALVSALAWSVAHYAVFGVVFGVVGLWRRVASTNRLVLIGLVMVAAMDLIHIVIDPMFGLPRNQPRVVMLYLALVLASVIYLLNRGAERELSVPKGTREV
jgi:hypothetical protein